LVGLLGTNFGLFLQPPAAEGTTRRDGWGKGRPTYQVRLIYLHFWTYMKYFLIYLSTAPIATAVSLSFLSGLLIEINRFYPDALSF